MPHAIWKGSISFGLVTIPVTLYPAEERRDLSFRMLDGRDMTPVKQRRINERTGEEIPWDDIAKGFELEEGRFIIVTEEDFRAADVEATQTIDVIAAVCADEVDPLSFDTRSVPERVVSAAGHDPWGGYEKARTDLEPALFEAVGVPLQGHLG